jgi:hypothetical protein
MKEIQRQIEELSKKQTNLEVELEKKNEIRMEELRVNFNSWALVLSFLFVFFGGFFLSII